MISSGFEIEARSFPGLPAEDQRWERAVEMGGGFGRSKNTKEETEARYAGQRRRTITCKINVSYASWTRGQAAGSVSAAGGRSP